MRYKKTPFTTDEHIDLLITRKLTINNRERAKKYIENIGYFRLTGYMYHLQSNDGAHEFKEGVSFDTIIRYYHFDKKLRSIFMEYLERIEICLRSKLTNYYSLSHGFYWYRDHKLYEKIDVYNTINNEITSRFDNPQERYLKAFKAKYTEEENPPSNMAMETLTLGNLSRLYKGLVNGTEKMSIAHDFGLQSTILSSWLIFLNNIRNICAHHSRLWNRGLTADKPIIPKRKRYQFYGKLPTNFNSSVYGAIALIDRILSNTNSKNRFITKIVKLLDEYSCVETKYMGFPDDWRENPAWGYCKINHVIK